MRARLLALAAVAAAALSIGVAGAVGAVPGSSYQWQQPGTSPVLTPGAQPELSFGAPAPAGVQNATTAYTWAQPGSFSPNVVSAYAR